MSEKKKSSFLDELDSVDEVQAKADKAEKYKAPDKGKKNRIGFPLLKKTGKLAIKTVEFFKGELDGKYVTFVAPKNEELRKLAERKLGKPVTRYLTIICKYPIKKNGELSASGDYELFLLVMDNRKFQAIQLFRKLDYGGYELLCTCTYNEIKHIYIVQEYARKNEMRIIPVDVMTVDKFSDRRYITIN